MGAGSVENLTPGTQYWFRLSVSGGDNDGTSNVVSLTTDAEELALEAVTTDFGTGAYDFEHTHAGNALLVVACTGEGLGQPACTLNSQAMTHVGGAANEDSNADRVDFFLADPGESGTIALDRAGCATALSFSGFTKVSAVTDTASFNDNPFHSASADEGEILVAGLAMDDNAVPTVTTDASMTEHQKQVVVAEPGDLRGVVATKPGEADGTASAQWTFSTGGFFVVASVTVSSKVLILEAVTTGFGTAAYDFAHTHTGNGLLVVACTGEGLGQPACTLNGDPLTHIGGAANGDSNPDRVDFFLAEPGESGTIALDRAGCATAFSFSGFSAVSAVTDAAAFGDNPFMGVSASEGEIAVCGLACDDNGVGAVTTTGFNQTEHQNQVVIAEPGDLTGAVGTKPGEADGTAGVQYEFETSGFYVLAAVTVR